MTDVVLNLTDGEPTRNGQPPPVVIVNNRNLAHITHDILRYLEETNRPPYLYVRAGQLTRVRFDENRRPALEIVGQDQLRYRIARTMHTVRMNKDGATTAVPCPADVVKDVLAHTEWPFPPLESITELPTLRPDGTIHSSAGYDRSTRRLHIPARGLEVPIIPGRPSTADVATAVALLREDLLVDFPFESDADLANAMGLLLTPIVRPAIAGQIPLALVDAPEPGTGKGLLANVANVIATGRPAAARPLAGHDDEVRKMLTATLLEGPTLVVLDNVEQAIKSPTLAAVLTTDEWSDRLLGRTETITVPNRATWIATGNNMSVGGDIGRRCYRIRLDAHQARPYTRTGFRHPDLIDWAQRRRGDLVAALLTISRAWYADGCPVSPTGPTIGGFTPWAHTIAGILGNAGVDGFLTNLRELHASLDVEAQTWEAFLVELREIFGDRRVTAGEIAVETNSEYSKLRYVLPGELVNHVGKPDLARRFGEAFRRREGRRHGHEELAVLNTGMNRNKTALWAVVALGQAMTPRLFDTPTPETRGDAGSPNGPDTPESAGSPSDTTPENQASRGPAGSSTSDVKNEQKTTDTPGETDPASPRAPRAPTDQDLGLDF